MICRKLFKSAVAAWCGLLLLFAAGEAFRVDFAHLVSLAAQRYGGEGRTAIESWQALLARLHDERPESQLEQVNRFVNHRLLYADDQLAWGANDYWATPLESLGRGVGDCEDSAFAKYVSLLLVGIPDARLRLTYVRARVDGQAQAHMVLSYYPEAGEEPLILDSLVGEILPASQRKDLFPIYSFNTSALWVGANNAPAAEPSARLSHWRSVLARMQEEGWQ